MLGFGCNVRHMAPAALNRNATANHDHDPPLMSCGARLHHLRLIIPLFADHWQGFMMWLIYIIGVAMPSAPLS